MGTAWAWIRAHGTVGLLALLVAAGGFLYLQGKQAGELQAKVAGLETVNDSLRHTIKGIDTLIVRQTDTVIRNRTRVVVVDSTQQINIDSANAVLRSKLDAEGQVALTKLTDGYEAKLAIRDKSLADQQTLIALQQRTILERDKLIASQAKEIALLKHHGIVGKVARGLVVAGAFVAGLVL